MSPSWYWSTTRCTSPCASPRSKPLAWGMTMWSMQMDTRARGIVEAQRSQSVGEKDGGLVAMLAIASVDERRQRLLVEGLVYEIERQTLRQNFGGGGRAD